MISEAQVLISIHPNVVRLLIPEYSEKPARALRVAVPIHVVLQGTSERSKRVSGFTKEGDTERSVSWCHIGGILIGQFTVGSRNHILHADPPTVVFFFKVLGSSVDTYLSNRLSIEVGSHL